MQTNIVSQVPQPPPKPQQQQPKTVEAYLDDMKEMARARHGKAVAELARVYDGIFTIQNQEIARLHDLCKQHNISIEPPQQQQQPKPATAQQPKPPNRAEKRQAARKQAKAVKKAKK